MVSYFSYTMLRNSFKRRQGGRWYMDELYCAFHVPLWGRGGQRGREGVLPSSIVRQEEGLVLINSQYSRFVSEFFRALGRFVPSVSTFGEALSDLVVLYALSEKRRMALGISLVRILLHLTLTSIGRRRYTGYHEIGGSMNMEKPNPTNQVLSLA